MSGNSSRMLANSLEVLRAMLSGVLFAAFCLAALTSLFLHAVLETLTSPDEIVTTLHTTRFAERSRPFAADILVTVALKNNAQAAFLRAQPAQVWESVAQNALPLDWLEASAAHLLLGTLNWLTNEQLLLPEYTIDLTPPRQTLNGPQGSLAVLPLLQNIPECPADTETITLFDRNMVSCLPANQDLTDLAQVMAGIIANGLPDQLTTDTLRSANLISAESFQSIEHIRAGYRLAAALELFGLRLSIFLLCFFSLLQARSVRTLAASLPILFLSSGVLAVLLAVGAGLVLEQGLTWLLALTLPMLPASIQLLLADILREFLAAVGKTWLAWSATLLAVGGILLVLRILDMRLNKTQATALPQRRRTGVRKVFR